MFCLVWGFGLGILAIMCFRQWEESEESESAACWLLSHNKHVPDCLVEDDISCDRSDSSVSAPRTRHKPKYCHKRMLLCSLLTLQHQTCHSTTEFIHFPKRVKQFWIYLKVFVEEN